MRADVTSETIFALSSGRGAAGVAVIRVSGPGTRFAIETIAQSIPSARKAVLRHFMDPRDNQEIDSGLLLFFPKPHSFTGEDVAEFHLHGSVGVVKLFLDLLASFLGFRAAEAGEFSRRALLGGKLDLIDVETIGDILQAETAAQVHLMRHYQRNLRDASQAWRDQILQALALVEANIDFIDQDDVVNTQSMEPIDRVLCHIREALAQALQHSHRAERLRDGFRVAIIGAPNAGKSSLLNALAGRDAAIVSESPGTTRDLVEVHLDLGGYPILLTDTAGLRDAMDPIEREGILRARASAEASDLILVLHAPDTIDSPMEHFTPSCEVISVRSKADLAIQPTSFTCDLEISIRQRSGLDSLKSLIVSRAEAFFSRSSSSLVAVNQRQVSELQSALRHLDRACAIDILNLELKAEEIRLAHHYLLRLVGKIDSDAVLGAIFTKFCIGK